MTTDSKSRFNIPGIISLYSSLILVSSCAIVSFCIQQNIMRYDNADLLAFVILFFIPVFASWGGAFGIIGLTRKGGRKVFAIAGTSINAMVIGLIAFLWIKFILFFSNFNGWID